MDRTLNKKIVLRITTITVGKIEGKAGRRRPRTPFLKRVTNDNGIRTYWQLKRNVSDRKGEVGMECETSIANFQIAKKKKLGQE